MLNYGVILQSGLYLVNQLFRLFLMVKDNKINCSQIHFIYVDCL